MSAAPGLPAKSVRLPWKYPGMVAGVIITAAAFFALHHLLAETHLSEILERFRATPVPVILAAIVLTAVSYLLLTFYDVLALVHLGRPLPWRIAATASFISYTFSHNIGLSLITGGSVRYRLYTGNGLSGTDIVAITGLCAMTFGLGITLVLGAAMVIEPNAISLIDKLPPILNSVIGWLFLGAVCGFVAMTAVRHEPITVRGWLVTIPSLSITVRQVVLGALDLCVAAGALYVLLPASATITYPAFVGLYVAAITIGVISNSPGGLGVFEAVMLLALPGADPAGLLGALLVYRCIYYLLPFTIAACLLAFVELRAKAHHLPPQAAQLMQALRRVTPQLVGTAVFVGGVVLLLSGATPNLTERTVWLRDFIPLPFIEASHFLASLIGLTLLILARGLFRRVHSAYVLCALMLFAAIIFTLIKGLDYEEAVVLTIVLMMLVLNRQAFYRRPSIMSLSFSPGWALTVLAFVGASIWLGFFSFKHVEYSEAMWWNFAYRADASRFLRASVLLSVLAAGFLGFVWLRPAIPRDEKEELSPDLLATCLGMATDTNANLALTGDKRFISSTEPPGLLMYQVQGRSWIAMGEPLADDKTAEELLWRFREQCDRYGGWPIAYQVGAESLSRYIDQGYSTLKLGEEARVPLAQFSLEGSARRKLRYNESKLIREGASFEILRVAELPEYLDELRAVSESWLKTKSTSEKRFSVGRFDPVYLSHFDCAVVKRQGKIVAFANIWTAPAAQELSIDLMRYNDQAPAGVMDFLFTSLMVWGREQGFRWFNLGMAPLAGLETHPLGPTWHRIGAFVFKYGEHFYSFEGLRKYKDKFAPVWRPKYLAAPGGLALPRILLDIAALTSGGFEDIFRKHHDRKRSRETPHVS